MPRERLAEQQILQVVTLEAVDAASALRNMMLLVDEWWERLWVTKPSPEYLATLRDGAEGLSTLKIYISPTHMGIQAVLAEFRKLWATLEKRPEYVTVTTAQELVWR
jgi:hypothetical protein